MIAGRSGVLAISPPSQYSPPSIDVAGNTGGRLALATTCRAVSPSRWLENSVSAPLLTSTAVTITSVGEAFSRSKSTHSSSAASSGADSYMCVASVGKVKYTGFGRYTLRPPGIGMLRANMPGRNGFTGIAKRCHMSRSACTGSPRLPTTIAAISAPIEQPVSMSGRRPRSISARSTPAS